MTTVRSARQSSRLAFVTAASSLGMVLVARTEKGIAAVFLGDDRGVLCADLARRFPDHLLVDGDAALETVAGHVVTRVDSPTRVSVTLPVDLHGSAFQQQVWQALREIPVGMTATYSEIARRIGRPTSVRAVAGACAANPVAILVPCHRVIRSDGGLSGYRWGVERKRELLQREAAA